MVGRGIELVRDEVEALGAAMDIGGLGHARDTLSGRMLSAVVFLSGRAVWPVGTVGPGMDDSSASLDNTRAGGARLYSQCKQNARGGEHTFGSHRKLEGCLWDLDDITFV